MSADYYDRPVLKPPVWSREIPLYFFFGGLAGASGVLAFAARLSGNARLARSALLAAVAGAFASPPLLIADLGRPERFLNMFRVLKPTSPMSVGSFVLGAFGGLATAALGSELFGVARPLGRLAEAGAALLGLPLSTYTAVLISDTAVPVWQEARRYLPFVFAGGAAASAGAAAAMLTPAQAARPARRLALLASLVELGALFLMENDLGELAEPYRSGPAAELGLAAKVLTASGALGLAALGRWRIGALAAGGALLGGSVCERFSIIRAGRESVLQTARRRPAAG
jgi:formate-dependent nitrite reductase membrane component NrfD